MSDLGLKVTKNSPLFFFSLVVQKILSLLFSQGFWFRGHFLEGILAAQKQFRTQPSDIVLCSFSKTGTTWVKALCFAITTRNHFDDSTTPLLTTTPHECIPFLEVDPVKNPPNRGMGLPLLATHIPYTSLTESIIMSGCKMVYMWRDARDAFVSMWQFAKKLTLEVESISLEEAFELFCEGISAYGPYWDHISGYWKASLERPDHVFLLRYEDVNRDASSNVKRLAEFLTKPFSREGDKGGGSAKIIRMCSFEHLSNLEVNRSGKHRPETPLAIDNHAFFRKGEVGDWENYLTTEMKEKVYQIMGQKLRGSGLVSDIS